MKTQYNYEYDFVNTAIEAIEKCRKTGQEARIKKWQDENVILWLEAEWVPHPDGVNDVVKLYICDNTGTIEYSRIIEETKKFRRKSAPSSILIWNKETGFIQINEGDGSNLLPEDEAEGYVDYMMVSHMKYDGLTLEEDESCDNPQVMLTEAYGEKFHTAKDVVQHLIDCGWIEDTEYIYLYENQEESKDE